MTRLRMRLAVALLLVAAATLTTARTSGVTLPAAAGVTSGVSTSHLGTTKTLSTIYPMRLVQSTGNLYWTANVPTSDGDDFSRVYRMSKSGTPGTERLLYQETHPGDRYFSAFAWAKVGNRYWGYFVVNNSSTHTSVIKRVSLGGGPATTLVTSPRYIGNRDLVSDGTYLFWGDAGGLRRSRVNGTELTTLYTAASAYRLDLNDDFPGILRVYFATGTVIRSISPSGTGLKVQLTTDSTVLDLEVDRSSLPSIYWSEVNGSVRGRDAFSEHVTYQAPSTSGRKALSVSVDGSRAFWTDCATTLSDCRARTRKGNDVVSIPAGAFAHDMQVDDSSMYWGDSDGIRKYDY